MSLQHRLPTPAVCGVPQTLMFQECSQQTRIALATSGQKKQETRACEGVYGPQETIDGGQQRIEEKMLQRSVRDVMLATIPSLRAFAMSLSGNVDRADDLVQGTLVRAIANIDSFQPGTNMLAWLFTILRNQFRSEYRKRRREVEDEDGSYLDRLTSAPEQHRRLELEELFAALAKLPLGVREALVLVGASGFSYDEAAAICGAPVGTIKSRVNRARTLLAEELGIDRADKFGPRYDRRGEADESDQESPS